MFGFNSAGATGAAAANNAQSALTTKSTLESGGAFQTDVLGFSAIRLGGDDQTLTFTANDPAGNLQSLAVVLRNDGTARNARTLDEAVAAMNTALQQSNNDTLSKIVAVKEQDGTTEGIRFLSTVRSFKVGVGTTGSGAGVASQSQVMTAEESNGGSAADISSQEGAASAVAALATSVQLLGDAQAVVGRGQNQFNFAVNLASSQVTNLAASDARIRDADLAAEAANLTEAQIALQAGVAALAQANSAPQTILSLLQR